MRFNLIGTFFNQTLPSSIGGDAVRLWLVARGGAGWRAATYSIFVDRAIGLIALAIIIVASLPWSYSLIGDPARPVRAAVRRFRGTRRRRRISRARQVALALAEALVGNASSSRLLGDREPGDFQQDRMDLRSRCCR